MDEVTRVSGDPAVSTGSPSASGAGAGRTPLERYKLSLRRYSPVQKGLAGLPWEGEWLCGRCGETTPGRLLRDPEADGMVLQHDCPRCGAWGEPHVDVLFTTPKVKAHPRQPRWTLSGWPIRPIPRALPRTVETLCPECSCLVLGRSYERDGAVWMEKTCPEHGYREVARLVGTREAPIPPLRGDTPPSLLDQPEQRRRGPDRLAGGQRRAEGLRVAAGVGPGPGAPQDQPLGLRPRGRRRLGGDDAGCHEPLGGRQPGPGQGKPGPGPERLPVQPEPSPRGGQRGPGRGDDAPRAPGLHVPPAGRVAAVRGGGEAHAPRPAGSAATGHAPRPALRAGRSRPRRGRGGPRSGGRGPRPADGPVHLQRRALRPDRLVLGTRRAGAVRCADLREARPPGREKGNTERFVFACGTEGDLAEVPVFVRYQPKWWFKVEGVLDPAETL